MAANKVKQAAFKLFAIKGYEATTMRDIGKEAGIKAASIYAHFASKEVLFLDLVSEMLQKINWELTDQKIISDIELKETLFNVFQSYYNYFSNHEFDLRFWQRIRYFPPVGLENKYDINKLGSSRMLLELYVELFSRTKEETNLIYPIEMYVMSYFSFVSGYIDSLLIVPFRLNTTQLKQAFDIFWYGLK